MGTAFAGLPEAAALAALDMTDPRTAAGPQAADPELKGLLVSGLRGWRIVDQAQAELCLALPRKRLPWLRPKVRPKN